MGFLDIIDPAIDSIKRILNFEKDEDSSEIGDESRGLSTDFMTDNSLETESDFILDKFIQEKLLLDPSKLEISRPQPSQAGSKKE